MNACIIDDEFHSRQSLNDLITEFCKDITVIGMAENAQEGLQLIQDKKPDIIFLDIQMPGMSGLELLNEIDTKKHSIIFTTAHNQYVLPALRSGAIDYLEKPLDIEELIEAIARVTEKQNAKIDKTQTETNNKLVIPLQESTRIITLKSIIYFEAVDGYTNIYLTNSEKLFSSRNIKWFEERLPSHDFFRCHKSFLIHWKHHVSGITKQGGTSVMLSNNAEVPVSRRKLVELNMRLAQWA